MVDMSIDELAKELHEEIPKTSNQLAYDITKSHIDYMKNLEDSKGRISDFTLGMKEAKELGKKMFSDFKYSFFLKYLEKLGVEYDKKKFEEGDGAKEVDQLIFATFGISEDTLVDELAGSELTADAIRARAERFSQRAAQMHQQYATAILRNKDKLKEAQNYIEKNLQAKGYQVDKSKLDENNAPTYLAQIGADVLGKDFIKRQTKAGILSKYTPPK